MTQETQQLQVGDIVIMSQRFGGYTKYVIERVTNTLAISGELKLKREYHNPGYLREHGTSGSAWNRPSYSIATPELAEKLERQNTYAQIKQEDIAKLPLPALKMILDIIKTHKG